MTDYPIGTVADIVTRTRDTCRAIRRRAQQWACACGFTFDDDEVTHIRPLLVLDPADLPSVGGLRHASRWAWATLTPLLEHLANALDALPPATEPEPESLTDDPGHGVIVEDRAGCLWTRLPGSDVWATASAANDRNWPSLLGNFGPLRLAEDGEA